MKRRANKKRIRIKQSRPRFNKKIGVIDSPMFEGLVGLMPVLILVISISFNLFPVQDRLRSKQHQAGRFPRSTLAHWELAREAASRFDYVLAEAEYRLGEKYTKKDSPILGVSSEIGDMVWPEVRVMEEVKNLNEASNVTRSRSLLLKLAVGYWSLGENKLANEMLEKAASIDPNDSMIDQVSQLLSREK